ncbi:L-Aspartase-like protein [Gautieria morchelliformis]|nr:L-Aspartase-like protein [Gautieria morchelliformis]
MVILGTSPQSHLQATIDHSRLNGFASKNHVVASYQIPAMRPKVSAMLDTFLQFQAEFEEYRLGKTIKIDGESLSIPAIVAAARFSSSSSPKQPGELSRVVLTDDPTVRARVERSRQIIESKVAAGKSIYGVSTGFGGSADTRTDYLVSLGLALIQHQHIGILPNDLSDSTPALNEHDSASPMPLGHSGVRWILMESMIKMLNKDVIPVVPLRGSVSASGDLSPLSYIAGAVMGFSNIFVQFFPPSRILPASQALPLHGLEPLSLLPKEHLGMINGTGFSASVGALIAFESVGAVVLGEVLTAMGTEALLGTQANFAPFISDVRPHPGQIEASSTLHDLLISSSFASSAASHADQVTIAEDAGELRQDRYSLRTAPQWIGPLIEDVLSAVRTVEIECNSTTDNPLFDPSTSQVHHGGNFQALALTTAFEKTRLATYLLAKILFAQATEVLNPAFNRGLSPSVAATDPSLNYHAKGMDIAMASYVSELGWLASNVATHVQSAEMHNQSVNSLALISGRATLSALEVLNMLMASYLYILCQALDLRALQKHYNNALSRLLSEELTTHLATHVPNTLMSSLHAQAMAAILASLDATTTMDAVQRLKTAASATTTPILDVISSASVSTNGDLVDALGAFRLSFAKRGAQILQDLRRSFVEGTPPPPSGATAYDPRAPAAPFLGRTRPVYEYVRVTLGVKTHGLENINKFDSGLGATEGQPGIGRNVSVIYEAIRDGKMQATVTRLFKS